MSEYFPYLRRGALILNSVIYNYKLCESNSISDAFYSVHKKRIKGRGLIWNCYPQTVGETVFNGSSTPIEIMLNHSLYGIYSRALTTFSAKNLSEIILSEGKSNSDYRRAFFKYSFKYDNFSLATKNLRSCNLCIAEDIESFGYAQWDLLHILPQVSHCPKHGCILNVEPFECNQIKIQSMNFPVINKNHNLTHRKEFGNDGYSMYLRNWVNLFEGQLNCVRHDEWATQIEYALKSFGSVFECYKFIYHTISSDWKIDASQLPNLLGPHIENDYIFKELNQLSAPVRIAQRLIILSVLESHGLLLKQTDHFSNQHQLYFNENVQIKNERPLLDLLIFEMLNYGFPVALARPILEGQSLRYISKQTNINRIKIRHAIACLSDKLIEDIFNSQQWGSSSWQEIEMRRRSNAKNKCIG